MSQQDILNIFFQYLILLAPLVIAYIFCSVIFGWFKKLAEIMGGKGW